MRTSRIGIHDVTATLIVAVAIVIYGLTRSGVQVAGMGSTRVLAAVVLALGLLACTLGARNDAFMNDRGLPAAITRVLSVIGSVAFFVGVAAIVTASEAMLAALVVLTWVLWLSATARHLVVPARPFASGTASPPESSSPPESTAGRSGAGNRDANRDVRVGGYQR